MCFVTCNWETSIHLHMSDSEEDEVPETKLKLIVVGDGACGKVCYTHGHVYVCCYASKCNEIKLCVFLKCYLYTKLLWAALIINVY